MDMQNCKYRFTYTIHIPIFKIMQKELRFKYIHIQIIKYTHIHIMKYTHYHI